MKNSDCRVVVLLLAGALAIPALAAEGQVSTGPVVATMDADGVQRATLTLDSYSYSPKDLIVEVNRPVELTLVSASDFAPHNLVLDDPAAGLDIRQDVGSGKSVQLRFTPTRVGKYAFFCDKKAPFMASHRAKGMEGTLEVRAAAN